MIDIMRAAKRGVKKLPAGEMGYLLDCVAAIFWEMSDPDCDDDRLVKAARDAAETLRQALPNQRKRGAG
ncbi:MAG: hypothetical protein ACYC3I_06460 [Gemmataceae bacterium]